MPNNLSNLGLTLPSMSSGTAQKQTQEEQQIRLADQLGNAILGGEADIRNIEGAIQQLQGAQPRGILSRLLSPGGIATLLGRIGRRIGWRSRSSPRRWYGHGCSPASASAPAGRTGSY